MRPARRLLVALVVGEQAGEEIWREWCPVAALGGPTLGLDPADLGPFNRVGQVLEWRELVVAREPPGERVQEGALALDDLGERRPVVAARPEVAELGQRRGVEGPRQHAAMAERRHALDHLRRSLVGEGDKEDPIGANDASLDRIRRPSADDACLARSCPRDDGERTARRGHGH